MNAADSLRVRGTRWLLLVLVCLLPKLLWAQTPAESAGSLAVTTDATDAPAASASDEPDPAATDSANPVKPTRAARNGASRPPPEPRFAIEVKAPKALRDFLLRHLELQRFRTLRDLDAPELNRLLAQAPDNLRDLLGTQGYFSPEIEVALAPAAPNSTPAPESRRPFLGTVTLRVEPGTLTRIASAKVYFRGDIAAAPEASSQRADIERSAALDEGSAFTQAAWDDAKSQALRALTTQRYPGGRIHNSLADIDPIDHSARLYLELDSGAPVRVGEVRINGIERYDPAVVERLVRLAGLTPGSDYAFDKLQAAQQRIANTGYFDSVFVTVEPQGDGSPAPVVVQVREGKQQKLVFGVGGSTDSGARLSLEHTHLRVPGIGWRALSQVKLERDESLLSTLWSSPLDVQGWRWIASAQTERQIDGFDTTTSQRVRLGQTQESTEQDRSFFLQYDRARVKNSVLNPLDPVSTASALSANYGWTRRRFDSTPFPNSGHGLGVELGVGTTLGQERRPFVRSLARWLGYWPLDGEQANPPPGATLPDVTSPSSNTSAHSTSSLGRLALRLQGGAVWAKRDAPIPDTQLFETGGDTTVRGYGLREIGVPQADGGVSPGRYLAVGSLEWQRPVVRDGVRTPWETVVFVDAGAVANQPGELRARVGVGAGVRYNSPVGPLQADLAYGVTPKSLRLHLTVGFTF
jgi:translocation and assembly module TamA